MREPAPGIYVVILLIFGTALAACPGSDTYKRSEAEEEALARRKDYVPPPLPKLDIAESDPLVLGEFDLKAKAIADGDTIKVEGLDASLRLLGIDTEEIYHHDYEKTAVDTNWHTYVAAMAATSDRPVKYGTPVGMDAMDFALEFFRYTDVVRLELDDRTRVRGVFGRYLTYVFADKGGVWVNYNVECVRLGLSPYFTKYGYSKRFHDEFIQAQEEARKNELGIWDPNKRHYPDYERRLVWWNRRADAIAHFEENYGDRQDYVQLGVESEWKDLPDLVGQDIVIFGTIGEIEDEKIPGRVMLSHTRTEVFQLIAYNPNLIEELGIERYGGEYIYVSGRLLDYKGNYEFIINDHMRIWIEPEPPLDEEEPN